MDGLRYAWDKRKNRDDSIGEDRYILVGLSIRLRLLVVCHSFRESERIIRIISARKADPSERRDYSRWLP
ncbi:MAG: BrnT family toxin [Steroidobacteraceae bacterium]